MYGLRFEKAHTHTHRVYKGQSDKGLKAAYGSVLSRGQCTVSYCLQKQSHVDIYGAGVTRLLLGNLKPLVSAVISPTHKHMHTHVPPTK